MNDLAFVAAASGRDDRAQVAGARCTAPVRARARRSRAAGPARRVTRRPRRGTRRRRRALERDVQAPARSAAGVVGPRDRGAAVGGEQGGEIVGIAHRRAQRPRRLEPAVETADARRARWSRRAAAGRPATATRAPHARPAPRARLQPRRVEADRRPLERVDRRTRSSSPMVTSRIGTGSATRRAAERARGLARQRVDAVWSPVRHATSAPPPLRTATVGILVRPPHAARARRRPRTSSPRAARSNSAGGASSSLCVTSAHPSGATASTGSASTSASAVSR